MAFSKPLESKGHSSVPLTGSISGTQASTERTTPACFAIVSKEDRSRLIEIISKLRMKRIQHTIAVSLFVFCLIPGVFINEPPMNR